ncbi:MAG: S8 family serine peptidase [Boseongicola sp.]|nr:S8 family serine peptidase [Boseongicola sp.]
MTLSWSDWQNAPASVDADAPYVDWFRTAVFGGSDEAEGLSLKPLPRAASVGGDLQPAPLPNFARPAPDTTVATNPRIELSWTPDADSVVVGVIDSAIALSHARFRRIDGGTRFLSAWLQAGDWRNGAAVPFGRELFRTEIERLMFHARRGDAIDEAAFDRAAGLTQFGHARGDRRLEEAGTHGTHVADLAAGFDLRDSSLDEARRRIAMIGVGLPPRSCIGASGNFLEFYAIHAIDYILDRADRIWNACGFGDGSFPVVINLSYGLQAGPKDGQMLIEKVIAAAAARAASEDRVIRVVLPVGNDLLSEGAAEFNLASGQSSSLDVRVRPSDLTPNFVEVWSDEINGSPNPQSRHTASIAMSPLGTNIPGPSGPGQPGQIATLTNSDRPDVPLARIYVTAHDDEPLNGDPSQKHRIAYVICTCPTQESPIGLTAPAGAWTLQLTSEAQDQDTKVWAYVQSDQSLTFGSETGLAPTFAHPDFDMYDSTGRFIDAYSYEPTPVLTDVTPPIQRLGTMNAIAHTEAARVIGSYRLTDGKPSIFSSAARTDAVGQGRVAPSALLPGEDGAARFGLIGAGSKSGSVIAMAGTSFSTALATRRIALELLNWIDNGRVGNAPGDEAWFAQITPNEDQNAQWPGATEPAKAGFGRMDGPETGRIAR